MTPKCHVFVPCLVNATALEPHCCSFKACPLSSLLFSSSGHDWTWFVILLLLLLLLRSHRLPLRYSHLPLAVHHFSVSPYTHFSHHFVFLVLSPTLLVPKNCSTNRAALLDLSSCLTVFSYRPTSISYSWRSMAWLFLHVVQLNKRWWTSIGDLKSHSQQESLSLFTMRIRKLPVTAYSNINCEYLLVKWACLHNDALSGPCVSSTRSFWARFMQKHPSCFLCNQCFTSFHFRCVTDRLMWASEVNRSGHLQMPLASTDLLEVSSAFLFSSSPMCPGT